MSHRFSSDGHRLRHRPGRNIASIWSDMFSLPGITGVLDSRELVVEVVQDGDKTAIRVDAQVTWQPARPGEREGTGRRQGGDDLHATPG